MSLRKRYRASFSVSVLFSAELIHENQNKAIRKPFAVPFVAVPFSRACLRFADRNPTLFQGGSSAFRLVHITKKAESENLELAFGSSFFSFASFCSAGNLFKRSGDGRSQTEMTS